MIRRLGWFLGGVAVTATAWALLGHHGGDARACEGRAKACLMLDTIRPGMMAGMDACAGVAEEARRSLAVD